MRRPSFLIALLLLLLASACYRATIELEKKSSTVTIEKSWAASWIFGLVPPKTVTTASRCPDGVAKVQTKLGIWNQVIAVLTIGIYTPMNIMVTCAGASTTLAPAPQPDIVVGAGASEDELIRAFQAAAEQAVQLKRPVFVQF